ncbi:MAG TPA: hypothetical protein VKT32_04945 [Chthonomonadaceae bacterium]|nr:hypothetical protein [Chthonomonadaceae bacterium]
MSFTIHRMVRCALPMLGIGLLAIGAAAARADIVPQTPSVTTNLEGGYTWTYNVQLANGDLIKSGNFFTITDFTGFVPNSNFQPQGWVFSSAGVGRLPAGFHVDDNPNVPDLTWTYTGSAIGPGPAPLGNFGAISLYNNSQYSIYAGQSTPYTPGRPGSGAQIKPGFSPTVANFGLTLTPTRLVPEMGSLSLLLPGLAPLALLLRKRASRH